MAKKKTAGPSIPSVLAFEKKLVPSDGVMYSLSWDEQSDPTAGAKLSLSEKSVRGTISNRLKTAIANDPAKVDAETEKANLQTVDHCALPIEHDTLRLRFTLKVLGGVGVPSSCNGEAFQESLIAASQQYSDEFKFQELARRYAYNLACGRFLWRNRVGAEQISINVRAENGQSQEWVFDAKKYPLRSFEKTDPGVQQLADQIGDSLSGANEFCLLQVTADSKLGLGQDVYPSEELVLDKGGKGSKSKILYSTGGVAAMHSQKLGNAIRTIDDWYDGAVHPIAVESYGSVTNQGRAYRPPTSKEDFYTLFDKFGLGNGGDLTDDQKHYIMAMLVRGGVFGESSK